MASVKFVLDTREESKTNLYRICLQITHKRMVGRINLGIKVKKEDLIILENDTVKLKKADYLHNITRLTNFLNKKKNEADDIIDNLRLQGKLDSMTLQEVKRLISQSKMSISLTDFMLEQEALLKQSKRYGTAGCKKDAVSLLRRYTKREDVSFEEVNHIFLKRLEAWWLGEGNHINGLGPKLRDIRNAFKEASKDSRIQFPKDDIPFINYKIKTEKTKKRAINIVDLKEFFSYEPVLEKEKLAKDFFEFSFIYAGMNPIDICMLKVKNVITGRLIYNRSKVKDAAFNWEIGANAYAILEKYVEGKGDDEYVFPIITKPTLEGDELRIHIKGRLKRMNEGIKSISEKRNIKSHVTSYVARHSWATLAKRNGVPVAAISEALGHSSIVTTMDYLADLEDDALNLINKQVGDMVFKPKKKKIKVVKNSDKNIQNTD